MNIGCVRLDGANCTGLVKNVQPCQTRNEPSGFITFEEFKLHGYTVRQKMQNTFYLPTDTHNAEKRRVIKTF